MKQTYLFFYGIFCIAFFQTPVSATDNRCGLALLGYCSEDILAILENSSDADESNNSNNKESEEFYEKENFRAKLKDRSFILKAAVTVGIIAGIGYLLYHFFAVPKNIDEEHTHDGMYQPHKQHIKPNVKGALPNIIPPENINNMEHEDKQALAALLNKDDMEEFQEDGMTIDRTLSNAIRLQLERARAHGYD